MESAIHTESKPAASARSAIVSSGAVCGRDDITTSRVGMSTPNSTPMRLLSYDALKAELEDVETADHTVDRVENLAVVDQDVVDLRGLDRRLAERRRHEGGDLRGVEGIAHVERPHAAVEEGADDDVFGDPVTRPIFVQVVGAEPAATPGELLHGRQRARADRHQLVLATSIDDPDELGPVLRRRSHRLVADDEQVAREEGHDGVTEAGERRVIIPAPEQPRP